MTVDGTIGGALISNLVEQLKHYLINYAGVSLAEIDTALVGFASAVADHNDFRGSVAIVDQGLTRADVISRFMESFGLLFYSTRDGLIAWAWPHIEDLLSVAISTVQFTDQVEILKGSFEVASVSDVASKIQYNWSYHFAKDYFRRQPDYTVVGESTRLGQEIRKNINLWYVDHETTALGVAIERAWLMREGQEVIRFALPISFFNLDLNNFGRLTHWQGPEATGVGYSQSVVRVTGLEIRLQPGEMSLIVDAIKVVDVVNIWRRYMKLGDTGVIAGNWATASDADKDYAYLGDTGTGLLGSDPIKRLF
jgi:hypothetical protein